MAERHGNFSLVLKVLSHQIVFSLLSSLGVLSHLLTQKFFRLELNHILFADKLALSEHTRKILFNITEN